MNGKRFQSVGLPAFQTLALVLMLVAVAGIGIRGQETPMQPGGATSRTAVPGLAGVSPPTHITGVVCDLAGAPAAGVLVIFHPGHYPGANPYCETKSDANGYYDLDLPGGISRGWRGGIHPTNFIMARWLERNLAAIEPFVTVPDHLDLKLKPGLTLSGSVKDTSNAPVTNATVELVFMLGRDSLHPVEGRAGEDYLPAAGAVPAAGSLPADAQLAENSRPMKVDGHGLFSFPALPQGLVYISMVKADGYNSAAGTEIRENGVNGRYEIPPFILMRADRIIGGQVLLANGQPLAGVEVALSGRRQQRTRTTKTDSQGQFTFTGIGDGPVDVSPFKVNFPGTKVVTSFTGSETNLILRLPFQQ
jgi:hypothetical protein